MQVSLHRISQNNLEHVLQLDVTPEQRQFVAPNVRSLAEAYTDARLRPLLVYPGGCCDPQPRHAPVGFVMYELTDDGTGFLLRLMIDHRYQRRGYGRATVVEIIRRLRLDPEVQQIATSHRAGNDAMSRLLHGVGFADWDTSHWKVPHENEVFLKLPDGT